MAARKIQCNHLFLLLLLLFCVAYSPLVAMMPRAMKALRLTSLLLCAMSVQRGSRAPRPSRATLFSSPDNRGSQRTGKLSTAATQKLNAIEDGMKRKACGLKKRERRLNKVGVLCNQIIVGRKYVQVIRVYQWEVSFTFICKSVDGLAGFDQDVLLRGAQQQHGRCRGFALHSQRLKLLSVRTRRRSFTLFVGRVSRRARHSGSDDLIRGDSYRLYLTVSLLGASASFFPFLTILKGGTSRYLHSRPVFVTCSHELKPMKQSTRLPRHLNACWLLNSRAVIWVKIDQNLIYSTDLLVSSLIQTLQGGKWLEVLR